MTEVDWDLLADHLGGALDGTPEQARVARLIATDPAWSRAAAQLAAALDAVASDLASLPDPGRMPAAVEARLTEALAGAAPSAAAAADESEPALVAGQGPSGATAVPTPATGGPPGARTGAPGPGAGRPGPTGPGARRPPGRPVARRRARWIGAGAVLAGVAAFAAGALGPLGLGGGAGDALTGAAPEAAVDADERAGAPPGAENPEPQPYLAAPREDALKLATGTDYGPRTVSVPPDVGLSTRDDDGSDLRATADRPADLPPELAVLWRDPTPCLDAVAAGLPSPPLAFERLDFAYFTGEPAVVIWVTASDGARWVLAAGPGCGSEPTDADTRYQRQLD